MKQREELGDGAQYLSAGEPQVWITNESPDYLQGQGPYFQMRPSLSLFFISFQFGPRLPISIVQLYLK